MAPLEVTSYGTRATTELALDDDELALMDRALAENAVARLDEELERATGR